MDLWSMGWLNTRIAFKRWLSACCTTDGGSGRTKGRGHCIAFPSASTSLPAHRQTPPSLQHHPPDRGLAHSPYEHRRLPAPDPLQPPSSGHSHGKREPSKQRDAQHTSHQNPHHRRRVHLHRVRPRNRHNSGRGHPGVGRLGVGYRGSQPPITSQQHTPRYARQQRRRGRGQKNGNILDVGETASVADGATVVVVDVTTHTVE